MTSTYMQWTRRLVDSPPSEEEARTEVENFATSVGIHRSNRSPGSREDAVFAIAGKQWYEFAQAARYIAFKYFVATAEADDLDELGQSFYGTKRRDATTARGLITLQLLDLTLSYDKEPGDIRITDGSFVFINSQRVVLDKNTPFRVVEFVAEEPGSAYNWSNDLELVLVTNMAGVRAKNPAIENTASWLTSFGEDAEKPDAYRARLMQKWALLARPAGQAHNSVEARIVESVPGIQYVAVDPTNPRGYGKVDIYVSGDLKTADVYDVANAQDLVSGFEFGTEDRFKVFPAREVYLILQGRVIYDPAYDVEQLKRQLAASVEDFVSKAPIGGRTIVDDEPNRIYLNDVEYLAEDMDGVHAIKLSYPSDDTRLGLYDKLCFSENTVSGLVWLPRIKR